MLILSGSAVLRHPGGEAVLQAGDVTCFPEGPAGAHRLINRGSETSRALFLSTMAWPANVCYPDSGTWILRNGPDEPEVTVHETPPA